MLEIHFESISHWENPILFKKVFFLRLSRGGVLSPRPSQLEPCVGVSPHTASDNPYLLYMDIIVTTFMDKR